MRYCRLCVMLAVLVVVGLSTSWADEIDSYHCLAGCPDGARGQELVVREIYILSNNPATKFADWVAYRITAETIGSTRTRVWRADPALPGTSTLEPADYTGANAALGTDRGHQVPLASFTSTDHWEETNYLSNITPQKSPLNQGPWNRLEGAVRTLAQQASVDAVFVMTGPLYERQMTALPQADEPHLVPSGYWKIVATETGTTIRVATFLFDQGVARSADPCNHLTTVDDVEQRSGLDFFRALPDPEESTLESGAATLATELGC